MFGDSPARGSDSAEVFNESVRELDAAGASDSSSDSEWEWHALVQGLPSMQRCSSCNGYQDLKEFRGLKQEGLKLFKTCNGCRQKKKQRPGRRKDVQHPDVTAEVRRERLNVTAERNITADFDSADFDALAKYHGDSDSSDFETFDIQQIQSDFERRH